MGERLGHYQLLEPLGRGGVGEVWRALDESLDRPVALKLLGDRFRSDPAAVARFRREAQLAAGLRHPNIVRVHSSGEIDGQPFIDMDLIVGTDLATVVRRGSGLELPRALEVLSQVARALDSAHRPADSGRPAMVHRDVKPANVLLERTEDGHEHVYLADFGVARAVLPSSSITEVMGVVGTPAYLAPEVWNDGATDHRVDVYALAVMAFQLVTGELPFRRTTLASMIAAHVNAPVPVASRGNPLLPRGFDDVFGRGMAKDPADRFPSAGAFVAALHDVATVTHRARGGSAPAMTGGVGVQTGSGTAMGGVGRRLAEYLGSAAHFGGLLATLLLVPLYLIGALDLGWTLGVVLILLYGAGASVVAALGGGTGVPTPRGGRR